MDKQKEDISKEPAKKFIEIIPEQTTESTDINFHQELYNFSTNELDNNVNIDTCTVIDTQIMQLLIYLIYAKKDVYIKDFISLDNFEFMLNDFPVFNILDTLHIDYNDVLISISEAFNIFLDNADDTSTSKFYEEIKGNKILLPDTNEGITRTHRPFIESQEGLEKYLFHFKNAKSIISNDSKNYYPYTQLIKYANKIFAKACNEYGDTINVDIVKLKDFVSDSNALKIDSIRLYEYLLLLEKEEYIKINHVNIKKYKSVKDNKEYKCLNFGITFLYTPKAIAETQSYMIVFDCLSVNTRTRLVKYNNKEIQFASNAHKRFSLLCLLARFPNERFPMEELYNAITPQKDKFTLTKILKYERQERKKSAVNNIPNLKRKKRIRFGGDIYEDIKLTVNRLKDNLGLTEPKSPLTITFTSGFVKLQYKVPKK